MMQFGILGRRIELFNSGMKNPLSKPVIPLLHFHLIRSSRVNQLSNMSFMKLILIQELIGVWTSPSEANFAKLISID